MTFPRSYGATKAREAGIEVRTCADEVLGLGLTAFPCACQTVDTALHTLKIARLHHVRDSRSGNPSAHNLRRRHQTAVRFRQVDDS